MVLIYQKINHKKLHNMKKFIVLLLAVVVNCLVGGTLSAMVGMAPWIGAVTLNAVAVASPFLGIEGLRAGLYTEIWTGETIKAFRNSLKSIGWLNKIRSFDSQVAKNNTIQFVDLGGDPTVLINNTTYPLGVETLDDADKAIGLDKYQTKATKITDDEARGLSYDKIGSVIERHRDKVDETKYSKALHALAPSGNTTNTPVLLTTGAADGTRRRMVVDDIIALKEKFDKMKVPTAGRILVLCPEHVNDLLIQDKTFAQRYNNTTTGEIANMYGFEIYEFVDSPLYTVSNLTKKTFGQTAGSGDRNASVAFYAPRMMKATGETKAYVDEPDTQTQEWRYNLRHYFICLPLKNEAIGAIVSDVYSEVTPTITGADTVSLSAAGTAVNRVYATSNGAGVTATTEAEWLTLTVTGNKVKMQATAYAYDAEATDPRTATVTIGIEGTSVTKEVTVSQAMASQA